MSIYIPICNHVPHFQYSTVDCSELHTQQLIQLCFLTLHCSLTADEDSTAGVCRWITTSPSSLWIWRWSTPCMVAVLSTKVK